MPTISPSSGAAPQTVTLTTATTGASIYYTTNGNFPRNGVTGATLYTAPFQVASAATLRCAAYKTGLFGSLVNQAIYT